MMSPWFLGAIEGVVWSGHQQCQNSWELRGLEQSLPLR